MKCRNCSLDFIARYGLAEAPMRSLTPIVLPGDSDWRDDYGMLNVADHYHNGGLWPFIGGFYVAARVAAGRMQEAQGALDPLGVKDQAWSAGMFLFARECVINSRLCLTA